MPDEPPRRLPGSNLTDAQRARLPSRLPAPTGKLPPTVEQLCAEGRIGTGWEHFSRRESATAEWLRARGVDVVSVRTSDVERVASPDAVAVVANVTVEYKTVDAATANAVFQAIRDGRHQSRRVVVDGRGIGLDPGLAVDGLAEALRKGGGDLDEVVVILTDDRDLHWP